MIEEENFPKRFDNTVLQQLWKRKGEKEDLNNHRYIHMKDWLPRLCESIVVGKMKQDIPLTHNDRWVLLTTCVCELSAR